MRSHLAVAALCLASGAAHAEDIRVIDGDTLVLGTKHVRLSGIDAPELGQFCDTVDSPWPAGRRAQAYLISLVMGRTIECSKGTLDRYGRTVATCTADGQDLGRAMVQAGMAWAYLRYSYAYSSDERTARAQHAGVHAHACIYPWDWRHNPDR